MLHKTFFKPFHLDLYGHKQHRYFCPSVSGFSKYLSIINEIRDERSLKLEICFVCLENSKQSQEEQKGYELLNFGLECHF